MFLPIFTPTSITLRALKSGLDVQELATARKNTHGDEIPGYDHSDWRLQTSPAGLQSSQWLPTFTNLKTKNGPARNRLRD